MTRRINPMPPTGSVSWWWSFPSAESYLRRWGTGRILVWWWNRRTRLTFGNRRSRSGDPGGDRSIRGIPCTGLFRACIRSGIKPSGDGVPFILELLLSLDGSNGPVGGSHCDETVGFKGYHIDPLNSSFNTNGSGLPILLKGHINNHEVFCLFNFGFTFSYSIMWNIFQFQVKTNQFYTCY